MWFYPLIGMIVSFLAKMGETLFVAFQLRYALKVYKEIGRDVA